MQLTPKYGIYKQIEYRNEITLRISKRYTKAQPLKMVSLGGAHCLVNKQSIENNFLNKHKQSCLVIVECNKFIIKLLNKFIKKNKKYSNRVVIFHGSLKEYLMQYIEFDILIADYYWTFNKKTEKDLRIIFERKLLNKNGTIFLTASEPQRCKNHKVIKEVKSYSISGDYKDGMCAITEQLLDIHGIKFYPIESWTYKNKDTSKLPSPMHVLDIKVA